MKNYNFVQVLTADEVREVCIRHQYYTKGTCQEYENLFEMCGYVTPDSLENIAKDIKDHSDTEDSVLDIMKTLAIHIHTNVTHNSRGNRVNRVRWVEMYRDALN